MTTASASKIRSQTLQRRRWRITGRVQGVGFRPFVHRTATAHGLSGFVLNDAAGVVVEAQGTLRQLNSFANDMRVAKPALAVIHDIVITKIPTRDAETGFTIEQSLGDASPRAEIAPDLALCPACLADMNDVVDRRRFGYGLVNCTDCGPRFSIIREVPYDRPNTTMANFAMCADCRREYDDPADRRFHAQPTACHACGPKVELVDPHGAKIAGDPIRVAAERLARGEIVAIKGIGGFHLAVRADSEDAVQRLRQIKHRSFKPFALMCKDVAAAEQIVNLGERARAALSSSAAPIVLAPRHSGAAVAPSVAPASHRLGVMVAYTPIHHLLFAAASGRFGALVMTSGNDSDEPLVFTNEDAVEHLGRMCDSILWHDRPIERPVDDSVILDAGGAREPIVLRRSRGYVPTPLLLPDGLKSQGLCVGGELKNAVAVVRENQVILSQHLGDLEHARTYANFKRAVADLLRLFAIKPQWIAHDLHPSYVSTMYAAQLAREMHVPRVRPQHHYAHAAAVLAEHGQMGPALAVVCDGTGYGTDHTIWGGELLSVDFKGFRRLGHLRPLRLPGGDAAAKQPWRSAMALLLNAFGDEFADHPIVEQMAPDAEQARFVVEMLRTRANCVSSSSAGRVFDGVAALLGICRENHFEAQAPLALESAAWEFGAITATAPPPQPLFDLREHGEIDLSPLVRELVGRRLRGAPAEELASLFHDQFVAAWEAAVMRAVEQTKLIEVVLSGGVLCNEIVDRCLTERLAERGLHVLRHRLVPPNDGGLALGQAALASHWAANGLIEK
jgi:hydrogenase maturation protein HypF